MHTQIISLPLQQAVSLDENHLCCMGVCGIFLDSIEAGCCNIDVTLDIRDDADDDAILRYLRGR